MPIGLPPIRIAVVRIDLTLPASTRLRRGAKIGSFAGSLADTGPSCASTDRRNGFSTVLMSLNIAGRFVQHSATYSLVTGTISGNGVGSNARRQRHTESAAPSSLTIDWSTAPGSSEL